MLSKIHLREKEREKEKRKRGRKLLFYLDGLCFTAPRKCHALSLSFFFSLFLVRLGVEGAGDCGGRASDRWRPAGVFMVYFWPQQQKAC